MIPKELQDILDEFDEEDISLWITKAELLTGDFLLDISVKVHNFEVTRLQSWTILARTYKKSHISFDYASSISITEDHPLLWHFTDTQCELYFAGQCKDVPKLFYDLYHVHQEALDFYECFSMKRVEGWPYNKPMQYSSGFLTQGPKKLLEMYGECLKHNEMDYSLIGERPQTYFDGQQYLPEPKDLKILFLGSNYVIAREYLFTRKS